MSLPSPEDFEIGNGEPLRLHRSEFLKSPAEHMIAADDRNSFIELLRYFKATHAVIPLTSEMVVPQPVERSFYRYDVTKTDLFDMARNERNSDGDSDHADTVVGQVITVRPYYLREYMKDMGLERLVATPDQSPILSRESYAADTLPTISTTCTHPASNTASCDNCSPKAGEITPRSNG